MHLIHLIFSQKISSGPTQLYPSSNWSVVFPWVFLGDLLNSKQAMVQPPCKKKQKILLKQAAKAPGKTGVGRLSEFENQLIWGKPGITQDTQNNQLPNDQQTIPRYRDFLFLKCAFLNLKYLLLLPFVDWIGWASHLEEYISRQNYEKATNTLKPPLNCNYRGIYHYGLPKGPGA